MNSLKSLISITLVVLILNQSECRFGGSRSSSRSSYSYSRPSYSRPSYSYSRPSYSAPKPSYSIPSYSAPKPSYSIPSYSAPKPSYSYTAPKIPTSFNTQPAKPIGWNVPSVFKPPTPVQPAKPIGWNIPNVPAPSNTWNIHHAPIKPSAPIGPNVHSMFNQPAKPIGWNIPNVPAPSHGNTWTAHHAPIKPVAPLWNVHHAPIVPVAPRIDTGFNYHHPHAGRPYAPINNNPPIGWNVHQSGPSHPHLPHNHGNVGWNTHNLPGGIRPPPGAPAVHMVSSHTNYVPVPPYTPYPASGHGYMSGYRPPPPPPGFLNSPHFGGAAPTYTYHVHTYLGNGYSSRSSSNDVLASIALWEVTRHRPHYHVYYVPRYTSTTYHSTSKPSRITEQESIEAGRMYIVTPNSVVCDISDTKTTNLITYNIFCNSSREFNATIILPSNQTAVVLCVPGNLVKGYCSGSRAFSDIDLIPVKFEPFNETAYYGVPLCNTTVIDDTLTIVNQTNEGNTTVSPPCVYPPYKWTGEKWSTIEQEERKEKIKKNLNSVGNLTMLSNDTVHALAHSTYFGKLFDFFKG